MHNTRQDGSVQFVKILVKTGLTFRGRILYNGKRSEFKSGGELLGKQSCFYFDRMEILQKGACSVFRSIRARAFFKHGLGILQNKKMEELYAAIEKKIKDAGYPRLISGEDVYNDICDQIEGKENGTYILFSKFDDDVVFEYHITVMDDDFNLGVLTMRTPEGVFETDFDE